jgi:hypothetical protein
MIIYDELDEQAYQPAARKLAIRLDREPELVLGLRRVDETVLTHAGLHHAVARAERRMAKLHRDQRQRERHDKPKIRYADVHGITTIQSPEVER